MSECVELVDFISGLVVEYVLKGRAHVTLWGKVVFVDVNFCVVKIVNSDRFPTDCDGLILVGNLIFSKSILFIRVNKRCLAVKAIVDAKNEPSRFCSTVF